MKYKLSIIYSFLFILLIFVGIYVKGWQEVRQDNENKATGKLIVFDGPFYKVTPIPEDYTGGFFASKHHSLIVESGYPFSLLEFRDRYKGAILTKVPCNEIFTIKGVYYLESKGILQRVISAASLKYYILTTNKSENEYVFFGHEYQFNFVTQMKDNGVKAKCIE